MAKTLWSCSSCFFVAELGCCSYFQSSLFAKVLVLHVLDFLQKVKDVGNYQSCFRNIDLSHFFMQVCSTKSQKPGSLLVGSQIWFASRFCSAWIYSEPFLLIVANSLIQHIPSILLQSFVRSTCSVLAGSNWFIISSLTEILLQLFWNHILLCSNSVFLHSGLVHKFKGKLLNRNYMEYVFIWRGLSVHGTFYTRICL